MLKNNYFSLILKTIYSLLLVYAMLYGFNKLIILFTALIVLFDIKLVLGLFLVIVYRGFLMYLTKDNFSKVSYVDISKYNDLIKINDINVKDYVLKDILVEYKKLMGNEFKPPSNSKKYY